MDNTQAAQDFGSSPHMFASTNRPGRTNTFFMRRTLPALLLLLILLTGCARTYVITMSSGARITTQGKPKLRDSTYFFKDAKGQPGQVSAGRVREIAPASMAKEEGSQFVK
jgi:hypothetical protein